MSAHILKLPQLRYPCTAQSWSSPILLKSTLCIDWNLSFLPVWFLEKTKLHHSQAHLTDGGCLECYGSSFVPGPGVPSLPFPRFFLVQVQPRCFYNQGGGYPPADPPAWDHANPWLLQMQASTPSGHTPMATAPGQWKRAGRWGFTPFPSISATNSFTSAQFISK